MRVQLMINSNLLKEFIIDQNEVLIGRDGDSDIQIDNIAVSRKHARITREHSRITKGPDDYFVEDLNSINGTFVNGQKVSKKLLNTGDEIAIGKYFLKVSFDDDPAISRISQMDQKDKTYRMNSKDFSKIFN